jgi:hypothetical protein
VKKPSTPPPQPPGPWRRTVLIYLDEGRPAAFPDPASVRGGGEVRFEMAGGPGFELEFEKSPVESGRRSFQSKPGYGLRRRNLTVVAPAEPLRLKYSITVDGVTTDPEIIIEPT